MSSINKFSIQKSFAISAGAGSGKTYTLSRRYINALLGFDYFREDYSTQSSYFIKTKAAFVSQIVTITYTEAAALEMKSRIFGLIEKIITFNELDSEDGDYNSIKEANDNIDRNEKEFVSNILNKALIDISKAKISTIHSFCLDIIKSNADIARIDSKLDIIDDEIKNKELDSIIFNVFESNTGEIENITNYLPLYFFSNLIKKYVFDLGFRNSFKSFDSGNSINDFKKIIEKLFPLPELYDVYDDIKEDTIRENWFNQYIDNFKRFDAKKWSDVDIAKAPTLGEKKYPILNDIKNKLDNKYLQYYSEIDQVKEDLFFDVIKLIKSILAEIKNDYDLKLIELGKIDFDIIITKTSQIIDKCSTDYKYIMVDEFQDTNEVQFSIIKRAMNRDTNLFVVGDSKQSIYSFQGAQLEVFNKAVQDKSLFQSIEDMSNNYRSDGVVLNSVNKIFREILQGAEDYEATAQDLHVGKSERENRGSFKFLISSDSEESEIDRISYFIYDIVHYRNSDYTHISNLINENKQAIAILFDSSSKMVELKKSLKKLGIDSKVSATEDFYQTKEINDIFNVLKAIHIYSKKKEYLSKKDRYYIVGALRSNILRFKDREIKEFIESKTIPPVLEEYINLYKTSTLSTLVKYIVEDSNLYSVYAHFDDISQRVSNINKFLNICMDFEESETGSFSDFLNSIESAIYFSNSKEDEEFYISDGAKSIEICTIHSTKGLAYPLVLLGNSEKGLTTQVTSESLKYNNYAINNENRELVGFKIGDYNPLSHRILKQVDVLKHLAEKKRLLYVALTRAQHDVVISGSLKIKKDESIAAIKNSYLEMITEGLNIYLMDLYEQDPNVCIHLSSDERNLVNRVLPEYIAYNLKTLSFTSRDIISATSDSTQTSEISAALLGEKTHKIIEKYWKKFNENKDSIFKREAIFKQEDRDKIITSMNKFYESFVYSKLNSGAEHRFELEFNQDNKRGFIDLIYYDETGNGWVIIDFKTGKPTPEKIEKYNKQLDFYLDVLESNNLNVLDRKLLWL
ncbi:hypothetical protein EW093_01365 [Thiospirochaeta perfilievii]|uniref:DNA 3'-5' helicase n=1 Tax=Thiospirochaeta perfilievii TaxID=252967 RepID=A0A5C1Q608_9SPIO|nr:UvrD-helicase domain-containing protein [Thiospirochaeta perfilievii]QEN03405.1 hypothetical protein EW093_01365 [Thiospirochaeta perfilievii]